MGHLARRITQQAASLAGVLGPEVQVSYKYLKMTDPLLTCLRSLTARGPCTAAGLGIPAARLQQLGRQLWSEASSCHTSSARTPLKIWVAPQQPKAQFQHMNNSSWLPRRLPHATTSRQYHAAAWHRAAHSPIALQLYLARGRQQYTRALHWPRHWREGWSSFRSRLDAPYEYFIGSGYSARVAVINALYALHPHWAKMTALLLAERLTRGDRTFSWCYSMPVTVFEDLREKDPAAGRISMLRRALNWVRSLLRLLWLILVFTPAAATAPIVFGCGLHRKRWLVMFRRTLERGGPAFIKWGQWAATRRDIFPPDFCRELEKLHTQAPAHAMPHTEAAIREAFGFGIQDLFSSFECSPVASGSIGQIHKAVLSDTGARLTGVDEGTMVAVKVRHPGVSEAIERDFALMMWVAALLGRLPALQSLRLEESLKQFAAPLREQVDLGREAFHLHAFNYNFRKLRRSVTFPVPLYPLAAPQCLVETFEQGEHISRYVARGAGSPFNSQLAVLGTRTMLHMMLVDNLIHADLHPGNILVQLKPRGGKAGERVAGWARGAAGRVGDALGLDLTIPPEWYQRPRMVLLDAGMATHLSGEDQRNMVGLFESFSQLDGEEMADWVLRFSGEEQTCPDPEAFKRDVSSFFDHLKQQRIFDRGDTSNGAEALAHVLDMVRQYQVSLPGHICATVVTTLVLEGWSFELDPLHSTLSEVQRMTDTLKGSWWARWLMNVVDGEILDHMAHPGHAPRTLGRAV